ncbi:hypothetical protein HRbin36_00157 [bacterium HR36]|nr:hypothetical protein HRbin36_00157 [bacterium HR36]
MTHARRCYRGNDGHSLAGERRFGYETLPLCHSGGQWHQPRCQLPTRLLLGYSTRTKGARLTGFAGTRLAASTRDSVRRGILHGADSAGTGRTLLSPACKQDRPSCRATCRTAWGIFGFACKGDECAPARNHRQPARPDLAHHASPLSQIEQEVVALLDTQVAFLLSAAHFIAGFCQFAFQFFYAQPE